MNEIIKTALNRNDTQFVMIFHSFFYLDMLSDSA